MDSSLSQYKDLFVETAKEYLKSLSDALLKLEKNPTDKDAVAEIFRASHSLKGQSAAMGYEKTGSNSTLFVVQANCNARTDAHSSQRLGR